VIHLKLLNFFRSVQAVGERAAVQDVEVRGQGVGEVQDPRHGQDLGQEHCSQLNNRKPYIIVVPAHGTGAAEYR